MCSVLGCESWRRSAHRFNLPEDPERRLEWVQFLLEVNDHQVKESNWTDISICREHFTENCFKNVAPVPGLPQLLCGAVPTVSALKSEPEEPPESGTCEEVKTDDTPKNKGLSETIYLSDDEGPSEEEEEEEDNERDLNSDEDWSPTEDILLAEGLSSLSEEESDYDDEKEERSSQSGRFKRLCTDCGTFYSTVKPHMCDHKIKPFSCNTCGKRCVTELSLRNHCRIHDETKKHPCKYCNLNFQTKVDKLKHEEIHQNSKKPYKCLHCPETFSHSEKRRIHQSQHGPRELIKCEVCGLGFYYDYQLLRHSLVHTGDKPYKCSVCDRGFKQASHLKSHMRLHTGERPYKCQHCDKGFNHNVSLKSHIQRYHTSTSGAKSNKNKRLKENNAADAAISGFTKGSDSEEDNEERKHNTEKEVQKKITKKAKRGMKTSGRPKGRPKRI